MIEIMTPWKSSWSSMQENRIVRKKRSIQDILPRGKEILTWGLSFGMYVASCHRSECFIVRHSYSIQLAVEADPAVRRALCSFSRTGAKNGWAMASLAVNRSYSMSVTAELFGNDATNLMVISKQLIQEVNSLIAHKSLVLRVDKAVPVLLREPA